jgi:hypothetical protein
MPAEPLPLVQEAVPPTSWPLGKMYEAISWLLSNPLVAKKLQG